MFSSRTILPILISAAFILPVFAFAHGAVPTPLVPECNTTVGEDGTFTDPCDFGQLLHLINHLIDFLLLLAAPIAAIMFAYAGWLYILGGTKGDESKVKQAHGIFIAVVVGLVIALSAWLVVELITSALLK